MNSVKHQNKRIASFGLVNILLMAAITAGCTDRPEDTTANAALTPEQTQEMAGRSKARICTSCHGPNGVSRIPTNPSLAGLPKDYIAEQLHAFKDGRRQSPMMSSIALNLTDTDIVNLSVYFSGLPAPSSTD